MLVVSEHGNVLEVPEDPAVVGWWDRGAAPGSTAGSVLIAGHININGHTGALAAIPWLAIGDAVSISNGDHVSRYRVRALHSYPKSTGLPKNLFDRNGVPQLVLITCGGPFDSTARSYEDNIVAFADPA